MKRLALVTDAWQPQTNGVVNTLVAPGRRPGGARDRGAGDRARRAPHAAAAVVSGDPRRLRSLAGHPAHPGVRARRDPRRDRRAAGLLDGRLAAPPGPALHHQLPHALRRVPERALARCRSSGATSSCAGSTSAPSTRWSARSRCCDELRGAARGAASWCTGRAASTRRSSTRRTARDDVYAAAGADLALRRPRRRREEPRGLPEAAARGHQGRGRRRPVARGARSAGSPRSCGAATASATIWRRTSRAPTASCSRRAPRPSAT